MRPARWLSFHWSPQRQEIACDGERFAHPIATNTAPSHDVAHLLVASSWLPWKPKGTRDEVSVAEFNAVLLEHLGVAAFDAVHFGRGNTESPLARALGHARWFVEQHYAPFPLSFESALARFRVGLDVGAVVGLSPVFFRLRAFELECEDFSTRTFGARFCSTFRPVADALSGEPQRVLAQQLEALVA